MSNPKRNGQHRRKTDAERKQTHKDKYGTDKLPDRKHKNQTGNRYGNGNGNGNGNGYGDGFWKRYEG